MQPKPVRSGNMLFPERPAFLRKKSERKAVLAKRPLSSNNERIKKAKARSGMKIIAENIPVRTPSEKSLKNTESRYPEAMIFLNEPEREKKIFSKEFLMTDEIKNAEKI